MSKFQIIILIVFAFFIAAGLLAFSSRGGRSKETGPTVVVWGTVSRDIMTAMIREAASDDETMPRITYTQFKEETFANQLTEALALDRGPDAVLVSHDIILSIKNKLLTIPYESYPESAFKATYLQSGELYLDSKGIMAIPFAIDPLVMYWNRDLFTNANLSQAPRYWEEFPLLAETLTVKDQTGTISQSAAGLGEYRNVSYAKEILSLLIMQSGNPIIIKTERGLESTLDRSLARGGKPADIALTFFTQFANPVKTVYTWNRSLPNTKSQFVANKLGIYFGYSSDYNDIRQKNPYLNFDVALMPQAKSSNGASSVRMTYGKLYGLSVVRGTKNFSNTLKALYYITSKKNSALFSEMTGLPSVRIDLLTPNPKSAISTTFTTSALWSKAWLDPNAKSTSKIFQDMIEGVTSGRATNDEVIRDAHNALDNLL